MALRRNFSGPLSITDPVKSSKVLAKSCSWPLKKNFLYGGCGFFVCDINGGHLGYIGPLHRPWAQTVRSVLLNPKSTDSFESAKCSG